MFLEGLPGIGKTTILGYIQKLNSNIKTVPEIINGVQPAYELQDQQFYMDNDDRKINMYNQGNIVIDRGPLSTFVYNVVRKLEDPSYRYNINKIYNWFIKYKQFYQMQNVSVIYLTNNGKKYNLTSFKKTDTFGAVKNQKLAEIFSILILRKYVKNYRIIEYDFSKCQEVLNEIVNKFMCS